MVALQLFPVTKSSPVCKVRQNTRKNSLNCGSANFCFQWFFCFCSPRNRSILVIYGNYPSLGSSINRLLLGDVSSCCLVRESFTVRGNAGEFNKIAKNKRHLWGKDKTVILSAYYLLKCFLSIQTEQVEWVGILNNSKGKRRLRKKIEKRRSNCETKDF